MGSKKKLVFMLVADSDDRFLTSSTLEELEHQVPIRFLADVADLFAALEEQTPSIILIDYNLAPESGVEILKQLKAHERHRSIPVVVLTDSPVWDYHAECYGNGASTVIRKPVSGDMTRKKISTFFDYWINVAETF